MAEIPIQRKEKRNIWPIIIGLLLLAALLWYFLSRNNDGGAAVRTDSTAVSNGALSTDSAAGAMAGGMSSGAGAMAGAATGAAAGAAGAAGRSGNAGGALMDADIASVIHEVNQGEITSSRLAEQNASNSDVKAFAREMIRAHTAMDAQGSKLNMGTSTAGQSGLRDSVSSANAAVSTQLQSAGEGAAFDRAYLDAQVTAHQNTLAFLQRAQNEVQNADLKKMVTAAIPDVQRHLERARSLQAKVGQ